MDMVWRKERFDWRHPRPRKIKLDAGVYCPSSLRVSEGDADCDHDFEPAPGLVQPTFAVWKCTKCGREFKYYVWASNPKLN